MSLDHLPDPPGPPEAPRHVRLYRFQWIGLPLLAIVPILALAGAFGESWRVEEATSASLDATVHYPSRYRYKQLNSIEVWVTNRGAAAVDTLTVALDSALANRFSTVRAIPSFREPWEVELTDVLPGETRLVVIELQGERYGRHVGDLELMGLDTVAVPLSIRIFP